MKRKPIKGKAVLGQWGLTCVTVDGMFQEKIFEKELRRLKRLGFSASIVDIEIKIVFPKKSK
mgnify:CR=1 FL=1